MTHILDTSSLVKLYLGERFRCDQRLVNAATVWRRRWLPAQEHVRSLRGAGARATVGRLRRSSSVRSRLGRVARDRVTESSGDPPARWPMTRPLAASALHLASFQSCSGGVRTMTHGSRARTSTTGRRRSWGEQGSHADPFRDFVQELDAWRRPLPFYLLVARISCAIASDAPELIESCVTQRRVSTASCGFRFCAHRSNRLKPQLDVDLK